MKKILFITLSLISLNVFAQNAGVSLQFKVFTDTTSANSYQSGVLSNTAGSIIRVADTLYMRSDDLSIWNKIIPPSGGGGGNISGTAAADQVVVGSGTNTVSSSSALKFNTTTGLIVNETNSVAATFQRNAANTTFTQIDIGQPTGYTPAGDALSLYAMGSFYSSTGIYQADGGTIVAGAGMSAGLNIATVHSSAPVKVWTNGNERMRIMPSGYVGIGTSSPTSTLHNVGSFATAYVAKTANYTATASDYTINFTSGTDTLTLPTAVGITGRIYTIVNSGTSVNIKTTSSQTFLNVPGTPTTINLLAVGATQVQSTGAAWIKLN